MNTILHGLSVAAGVAAGVAAAFEAGTSLAIAPIKPWEDLGFLVPLIAKAGLSANDPTILILDGGGEGYVAFHWDLWGAYCCQRQGDRCARIPFWTPGYKLAERRLEELRAQARDGGGRG